MISRIPSLLVLALLLALTPACELQPEEETAEPASALSAPLTVGGCTCPTSGSCSALTYSDIPSNHLYYITTFGGGSDTQSMSCGGTADGTWAYVADSSRFGCGAKLLVAASGKKCVAKVADCGPNRCVEEAVCYCSCGSHKPILDASPYITSYLLGMSGVGWSDKKQVTVTTVSSSATVGCPADQDGDKVADTSDNCPLVSNASQADKDKDGVGDACDNCPNVANSGQKDTDGDKTGDACESVKYDSPSKNCDSCKSGDPSSSSDRGAVGASDSAASSDLPVVHPGGGGEDVSGTGCSCALASREDAPRRGGTGAVAAALLLFVIGAVSEARRARRRRRSGRGRSGRRA
jgi:hypothetical protein